MKKLFLLFAFYPLFFTCNQTFAEPESVECSGEKDFTANNCDVCYTETYPSEKTPTGWSTTLTDFSIPWVHGDGDLAELIYDTEQKYPEIKGTPIVTLSANEAKDVWKYDETLLWTTFDDHREFVLQKNEDVALYTLQEDQSITLSGTQENDHFLILTPLSFRDFNTDTNTETEPKTRNICIRGIIDITDANTGEPATIDTAVVTTPVVPSAPSDPDPIEPALPTPDVITPPVTVTTPEISTPTPDNDEPVELDSAGPAPLEATTITPDQTRQETGPGMWIALLLAFVLASGWNAWRKSV